MLPARSAAPAPPERVMAPASPLPAPRCHWPRTPGGAAAAPPCGRAGACSPEGTPSLPPPLPRPAAAMLPEAEPNRRHEAVQVYQTTKWFACITYFRYQQCGGRILEEEGGAESETETDDNDSGTDSKDDGENSDNKDDEKVKPEESPSELDMEIEGLAVEEAWAEPTGKKEEDESTEKISATALCVTVGSFCDPEDLPGLARFLEHSMYRFSC
ncbi:uncharacterized protein LOC121073915 isoform X1 [Cygnus olor]|uniref:uncharacterized protein LOC121073915 isoform X1 n=1 Tax=Cygnus olor TaxID=8869 RepID=UPI001ADEB741|nr:uncharacterized protein LOC121073915 isoform X1 [Cygnus olor]